MIFDGTITELATPDEYEQRKQRGMQQGKGDGLVGVGIKKPGRGKPTFFRVKFRNDENYALADRVVYDFAPGDRVTVTVEDESIHMVYEVDEIARTSAVISAIGVAIQLQE